MDCTVLYATVVAFVLVGGLALELRLLQRSDRAAAEETGTRTPDVAHWPTACNLQQECVGILVDVRVPPYIPDLVQAA